MVKVSTFSYNTGMPIQSFYKLFTALSIVPELNCHLQHFLEFGNIFGFWTIPVIDLEYFPRRSDPNGLR